MKVRISKNRIDSGIVLGFKNVEVSKNSSGLYVIFDKKAKKFFEFASYQVARRFLTELLK